MGGGKKGRTLNVSPVLHRLLMYLKYKMNAKSVEEVLWNIIDEAGVLEHIKEENHGLYEDIMAYLSSLSHRKGGG